MATTRKAQLEPRHSYRVRWEMDIDANSKEEAAQRALEIQRDPESIATVFEVNLSGRWVRVEV